MCLGVVVSPQVAFLIAENFGLGILAGIAAFGAWGMGFNLSSVSYLSLASELSGEKGRGKTIATMWFMMIVSIIGTAIGISQHGGPVHARGYDARLPIVGASALTLGLLGLFRLEPRSNADSTQRHSDTYTIKQMASAILDNPVAKTLLCLPAAAPGRHARAGCAARTLWS